MNGYCYILECADGPYYVGSTVDLERRLSQHELGIGAAYPRSRPVRLVWYECYPRIDAACAREKQIQNWGRDKRRALIEGRTDELPMLAQSYAARFKREQASTVSTTGGRVAGEVSTSSTTGSA